MAQLRLGSCCCEVEVSSVCDRSTEDDREFFVQAWCRDPCLIRPEESVFIPEPLLPGIADPGVRRGLRYQVFARILDQQGLRPPASPSPSDEDDDADDDDGFGGDAGDDVHDFDYDYDPSPRRDSDDDSVDSDPRHRNSHPTCNYPQEDFGSEQRAVLVGALFCPVRVSAQVHRAPTPPPSTHS